jgi:hypothetical protein
MLQYITDIYNGLIEHYAAMSTFAFIIAMLKLLLPIFALVINRISEYLSYKSLMKIGVFTDEQARKRAREIWRPKSKPPKWLKKIIDRLKKSR